MVETGSEPVVVEPTPTALGKPTEPNLAGWRMREGAAMVEPTAMGEEGGHAMVEPAPTTMGEPTEWDLVNRCMREGATMVEPAIVGEGGREPAPAKPDLCQICWTCA